jgi:hypothetical protein
MFVFFKLKVCLQNSLKGGTRIQSLPQNCRADLCIKLLVLHWGIEKLCAGDGFSTETARPIPVSRLTRVSKKSQNISNAFAKPPLTRGSNATTIWQVPDGSTSAPCSFFSNVYTVPLLQLRAESEADGKGSKKGKKKKEKKGAQPPEVPTPVPAGGEGDPFKPDEQRAVRTLDEIAPASRKDAPLALRGRNFAKEMPVLGQGLRS